MISRACGNPVYGIHKVLLDGNEDSKPKFRPVQ